MNERTRTRLNEHIPIHNPKLLCLMANNFSSPSLFNVFSEEIVSRSVEESTGGVCVQGLLVNNLRFPDDIDLIADNRRTTGLYQYIEHRVDEIWNGDKCGDPCSRKNT